MSRYNNSNKSMPPIPSDIEKYSSTNKSNGKNTSEKKLPNSKK